MADIAGRVQAIQYKSATELDTRTYQVITLWNMGDHFLVKIIQGSRAKTREPGFGLCVSTRLARVIQFCVKAALDYPDKPGNDMA